ncbi:hypothetical protein AMAG_09340 [Allomyces macrogynus ATCC 38327]|uniref:Uncharacterized protein n=1 Tax=Allomyces macrogynus (strain ATCC 38327) TaxID=578462 RepID=A0A0L0SP65_ALLM3|nr:hypothetical protein AMAG_09340 [Allomyces macrogynus ATCC 38327]|eukprot:KNE64311.1 hypothetical protein AMAG_09340 [Allomyces macrogynus ATCC 38327]
MLAFLVLVPVLSPSPLSYAVALPQQPAPTVPTPVIAPPLNRSPAPTSVPPRATTAATTPTPSQSSATAPPPPPAKATATASSTPASNSTVKAKQVKKTIIQTGLGPMAKEDIDALVNDTSKFNFDLPIIVGASIGGGFVVVLMFVVASAVGPK